MKGIIPLCATYPLTKHIATYPLTKHVKSFKRSINNFIFMHCNQPDILIVSFSCTVINQAVRKLNEAKKLESTAHYNADFGKD